MIFLCSWGGLPAVRQPHAAPWGVSDANLGKRVYWHKSSPRFFGRFESLSRPVFQPSADEGSERGFFSAGGDWSVAAERHDSTEGNKKSCCQPYSFLALNRSTLFSTPQVPARREGRKNTQYFRNFYQYFRKNCRYFSFFCQYVCCSRVWGTCDAGDSRRLEAAGRPRGGPEFCCGAAGHEF